MNKTEQEVLSLIDDKLNRYCATTAAHATPDQVYKATAFVIRDILLEQKQARNKKINEQKLKRVYYLCMEFLIGRSMKNNLFNIGLTEQFGAALGKLGFKLEDLYELEQDAGLGNGGLGRLAACFMDSLSTEGYPAMGFSIRYEYGLFKQKIVENQQVELPDLWLDTGDVWMMPRSDKHFQVKLGGRVEEVWDEGRMCIVHKDADIVEAMPYDVMVSGADGGANVLRLWRASAANIFDMKSFTQGDYMNAMRADNEAELISKVLYPSDDHSQGKQLRLSQQYFLVSASLQSILRDHMKYNGSLDSLPDKVAIHINDTHPALSIPELMRLLIDEHGYDWDKAWEMTINTVAYTNHTVMAEALEKWNLDLIKMRLPRIYSIILEINRRFEAGQRAMGVNDDKLSRMSIVWGGQMRMANLSVIGSHSVNGVSALHSDIIKQSVFKDLYEVYPERFTNVTNGIAHRRWLNQSNPKLTDLLTQLIGDGFTLDASKLSKLEKFKDDKTVLTKLKDIKLSNKQSFSQYISDTTGFKLNPNSRFDTQIKRLHEYKRQLLNVLKIVYQYLEIMDNPNKEVTPQTFIFGAKAAGSYFHAKRIIELINALSADIQKNPRVKDKLDVLFIENYNVTKAERLIPASEISEQISLAGKEASGTSNMKFMMNGAVTLGTVDGANVEILENVGEDNIFIFGLRADEVERSWAHNSPSEIYSHHAGVRRVVDRLKVGFGGVSFADIANYLVLGTNSVPDPYMCLMDFDDYMRANSELDIAYRDEPKWNKIALINIARSGIFTSDRSIDEYAKNIWNLKRIK